MKFYDEYIKDADKKGVSPGSEALKNLFDACGSCLILIDELVAYGKKIYGIDGLPAGTFDNLITFVQEVTEAARASQRSMIVASLPESEIEVGGTAGKEILEQVEHTFGRMESIWKPVAVNESFEVVRRRLFLPCKDEAAREQICTAFSEMYRTHSSDFPVETKDLSYKNEMFACYPIHPEFFHYLYDIWATIDHFQKTRGVLRLMAGVIYYLWINNDASAMIMPGSIPLHISKIRDELSRYLPENWNAIVDSEVDGKDSEPFKIDKNNARFGQVMAARRVARTIFLGSAPTVRGQAIRGVEESHIRLGVVQPKESISDFNDALSKLKSQLSYLYSNETGTRFWYDNRPTLRKLALDLEQRISKDKIDEEIEKRLRKWKTQNYFSGIHICPTSSFEIPDEQNVRLVILPFDSTHERGNNSSTAITLANEFFEKHGNSARQHKNMLLFLAADKLKLIELNKNVRRYKAWEMIYEEAEQRNLDTVQIKEANKSVKQAEADMKMKLSQVYSWIFSPYTNKTGDIRKVYWDIAEISCENEDNVEKAYERFKNDDNLINKWGAALLKMELNDLLWKDKDSIEIRQLWNYLTDYCYLPRLKNIDVLLETIKQGVSSNEYFAIAEGIENGHYLGLKFNKINTQPLMSNLLVKPEIAKQQLDIDKPKPTLNVNGENAVADSGNGSVVDDVPPISSTPPEPATPKHFSMDVILDSIRIHKEIDTYMQEVISHLLKLNGAEATIRLDVEISIPSGVSADIVNIVSENCRTLKVNNFYFED